MIKYAEAWDIKRDVDQIVEKLGMGHVDKESVFCFRSTGSKSRRIIARCWALPRVWQQALGRKAGYVIEVISERYDRLSREDQQKVLIHELLHIPKAFGGGIKGHGYVNRKRVEQMFTLLRE
jgi:predicted metallopeptidase